MHPEDITPYQLLNAYAQGYFPMADGRHSDELFWFNPEQRGVLPLEHFHIPRSLKKAMAKQPFTLTVDADFKAVMTACAEAPRPNLESGEPNGCWISDRIIALYCALHATGHAHSVECWNASGQLVGGLYGVSLGGVFCGESMFSHAPNASKIALVALVDILRTAGYTLLDTQYLNPHLAQFGGLEIPQADYLFKLKKALNRSDNPSSRFGSVAGKMLSTSSSPSRASE